MPKFDGVIFDVDGTITSTNRLIFDAFNHIAKIYLKQEYSDEEIIKLFGPTEEGLIRGWMKDDAEAAIEDYMEYYTKFHNEKAGIFSGMRECIKIVKSKNLPLGVFTGKGRRTAEITLKELEVFDLFDVIYTGDDVTIHKPHPEGINIFCTKFDLNPANVLMIGDAPADIFASRDAGCKVASVLWESYAADEVKSMNPDYIFNEVCELKTFLESI